VTIGCVVVLMWCEEDTSTDPGSAGQIRCFAPSLVLFYSGDERFSLLSAAAFYDLGCVSASNRRRCPCCVVRFRLPLNLCLCCCLFLGGAVFCDVVMQWWWWCCSGYGVYSVVVVMSGGGGDEWWC
jgi:hypothetical protein